MAQFQDQNERMMPVDVEQLADQFQGASPFPHICIDEFLKPEFAAAVSASYPTYDAAMEMGRSFKALNESLKVQICEPTRFPEPVKQLHALLSSSDFMAMLEQVTGIPKLLPDPSLVGGGMHVMGSGGRLDVHVDFNRHGDQDLFRRLNILVFLNEDWEEGWGGELELWDSAVRERGHCLLPRLNRCVLFATSEISFHGVRPILCPDGRVRKSFAAYYYTAEPPADWDGTEHTTIFRARPDEKLRGNVLMPAAKAMRQARHLLDRAKSVLRGRR